MQLKMGPYWDFKKCRLREWHVKKSLWLIIKVYLQISVDFTANLEKHERWPYCWLLATTILSCTFPPDLSNVTISGKKFSKHSSQSSASMATLEYNFLNIISDLQKSYKEITSNSHFTHPHPTPPVHWLFLLPSLLMGVCVCMCELNPYP